MSEVAVDGADRTVVVDDVAVPEVEPVVELPVELVAEPM
jgi:hypothetical protein